MTTILRILCFVPFICLGVGIGWELGWGWGLAATALFVWLDLKMLERAE